jgi:hypothetical protein
MSKTITPDEYAISMGAFRLHVRLQDSDDGEPAAVVLELGILTEELGDGMSVGAAVLGMAQELEGTATLLRRMAPTLIDKT